MVDPSVGGTKKRERSHEKIAEMTIDSKRYVNTGQVILVYSNREFWDFLGLMKSSTCLSKYLYILLQITHS